MKMYKWLMFLTIPIACILVIGSCSRGFDPLDLVAPDPEPVFPVTPTPPEMMPPEMMPPDEGIGIFDTNILPGHGLVAEAFLPGTQIVKLPDFDAFEPFHTWMVANIDVPHISYTQGFPGLGIDVLEWFAIRLRGQLKVETSGIYNFTVWSDDGARIFINGNMVIDNDGLHPFTRKDGSAMLEAGYHDLEIQYFQGPRAYLGLQWLWQPPGGESVIVPPEVLFPPRTMEPTPEPKPPVMVETPPVVTTNPIMEATIEIPNINGLTYSSNGQMIAAAGNDGTIKLWDATGELLKSLEGHTDALLSVAFSPDDQVLASASADTTIRLWDPSMGDSLKILDEHTRRVNSVAFSPDGQLLASAGDDMTVRLWDPSTGDLLKTLDEHTARVNSVAFSPDGQLLASASYDMTVRLWNPHTGQLLNTLDGHEDWVNSVVFSPDGQVLASASADTTIRLWDPVTGQNLKTLMGHVGSIYAVVFSPDGQLLATGGGKTDSVEYADPTVRLWNSQTGELLETLTDHTADVEGLGFSPDGVKLASGDDDGIMIIWTVNLHIMGL
jgi:roadblock/LC7 domain-containing protein